MTAIESSSTTDTRPLREFSLTDGDGDVLGRQMLFNPDAKLEVHQMRELFGPVLPADAHEWWTAICIPLALTRVCADAFAANRRTLEYATRENNEITEMVLPPTDAGLVKRVGRLNPNWHAVYISYQDGEILNMCAIYCVSDNHKTFESSAVYPYPQTQPQSLVALETAFQRFLRPRSTVVLTNRPHGAGVLEPQFLADEWTEWHCDLTCAPYKRLPRARLRWTRQFMGPYSSRLAQKALVDHLGPVMCSDADKTFTSIAKRQQAWMIDAPYRWPFQLAAMIEFCLATGGRLLPYCVLWVCDCIPMFQFHAELKRVRALEKIVASIRRVKEKRLSKRSTRSRTRLLNDEW